MKTMLVAGLIGLSLALQGCNRDEEVPTQTAEAPAASAPMPNMPMPGAAPAGQGTVYTTMGEVTAIGADSVTIRHEPVAELNWPSMNMMFKAPDAAMIGGLTPGAQVSFSFRQEGGNNILTTIERR